MRRKWDANLHVLQSRGKLPVPRATYAMTRVQHQPGVASEHQSRVASERTKHAGAAWVSGEPSAQQQLSSFFTYNTLVNVGRTRYELETVATEHEAPPERVAQMC